jgi:hypothetical protein
MTASTTKARGKKASAKRASIAAYNPADDPDEPEEEGKRLWEAFQEGAVGMIVADNIKFLGRQKSEHHIRKNFKNHTYDPGKTRECAKNCGVLAKMYSLEKDPTTAFILEGAFEKAWGEISRHQHKVMLRLNRIRDRKGILLVVLGGAC